MTRFEQRGLDAGRTIRDLTAVRTEVAWIPSGRLHAGPSRGQGAGLEPPGVPALAAA